MKRYSILHAFVLSFFSKSFYQDVGRRWLGTGLLYLAIVLAVLWIPSVIKMHLGFTKFAREEAPPITNQIPKITITHGQVSTDVQTPYFITNPNNPSESPLIIIDTTGQYQTLDNTPARILLTKTKLIAKSERDTRIYDLSTVDSFYVDKVRVQGWLDTAKGLFGFVAYPLFLLGSFVFRAIQILIYGLVGMLFARLLNVNLDYKTLMRLAAVAITPVLILNLLLEFLPFHIPLWWLIGTLIGLGYLFFAVKSNAEPVPMEPYQPMVAYPSSQP